MKQLKNLILAGLVLFFVSACKKSDDVNVTDGTMSAKIDGTAWTAGLAVQATKTSGVLSIGGTGNGGQINLNVLGYTAPGTYQLGGTATNPNHAIYTTTTMPPSSYSNMVGQGSGTLTITSESGGYVEGTFNFTAKNPTGGAIITITEGKFKAKLQ
ncbi:MAG: hypothetical protein EOO89_11465 [Pedobacter sp.]|nr:MAG: hypothetical protein EOO89_11465 [Pedobacter sp.]